MQYKKRNWTSGKTPLSMDNIEAMDETLYQNNVDINDFKKTLTSEKLQELAITYPVEIFFNTPTQKDLGKVGQLGAYFIYNTETKLYSVELYLCCKADTTNKIYQWFLINSNILSDEQIKTALTEYLKEHPLEGTGADGKTPVVGVDYFTESDKAQIVQSVIDSLGGTPVFGYVDEDNNVIVRGLLSDGTYSIKYELEDGTIVKIGELTLSSDEPDTPVYTNMIPLSTEADATPYNNGQGFKTGYRISGSSGSESAQAGTEVTGFIPVKYGDTVYLKNIVDDGTHVIALYGSNREKIVALTTSQIVGTLDGSVTSFATSASAIIDATTNIEFAFMRVSATEITADSIITVNEPIE